MIHPATELQFVSPEVGYGVFATSFIPRGTIVWTLCDLDRRFTPPERARLAPAYHAYVDKYGYVDFAGDTILCWDFGRYENHSCEPACLAVGPHVDVLVRDLEAGDQLTCEYGLLNLEVELHCRCGTPSCRGVIGPNDALKFGRAWDEAVRRVLPAASRVPQPLRPFVRDWVAFEAAVRDPSRAPEHVTLRVDHAPRRGSP